MHDWIVPDWPAPAAVRALITTRHGGVSGGACASLNLALHVGDDPAAVAENRARLRRHLPDEPLWLDQVHGVTVVRADQVQQGARADGSVTRRRGTVCAVMTADCLPLLLCDAAGSVVGIAHAGWRGLAAGVIEATVRAMEQPGGDLLAYLGPAIGPASFEVGAEVRAAFLDHDARASAAFVAAGEGKFLADIYELARQRLADAGVRAVFGGGADTCVEAQRFFSFRRDRASGRMAALIWLA
ncbi:MAG: hypothetical protein H6R11_936 [Proteobacteria bacterium]|jgi:hypothetical protein|nr:hypothetical protein [Pseudomonadota bacterium]